MIVIIGGGLAGLSTAFHLGEREHLVLERESEAGGLCRSRRVGDFVFDYTGHLLHLRDPEIIGLVDRLLPGAFDQYVADADTFFTQEFPALQQWSFRQEDAARMGQPVLAVVGARSLEQNPIWGERHQLLLDWLPNVEPFVLPDATHLLQVTKPHGMAKALAAFFARHPLSV